MTNSKQVAKIKAETTPYALEKTFLPIKYVRKEIIVPHKATGNLAVNSFTFRIKQKKNTLTRNIMEVFQRKIHHSNKES